jgi:hypothetical protein
MTDTTERRRDTRFAIRLEAHFAFGRVVEVGVLANISYSGALIEDITMQPAVGTDVVLGVHFTPPSDSEEKAPFELTGIVVRHTSSGFAIEYKDRLNPEVRKMVDDVAAMVAEPG